MNKKNVFRHTASLNPRRSYHDLSYTKKFTCDMGQLIPVMCDEVVPGDYFKIANQTVVRFQPLVAPILHQIDVFTHYFFVPYRLLWNAQTREDLTETGDWETFITGGPTGDQALTIPTWDPSDTAIGSLWDYFGFPTKSAPALDPAGCHPIDFPRRAYNFVYNNYYRDENFISEVDWDNEDVLIRGWEKDYFNSALAFQQRGTAPALPISGTTSAVWPTNTGGPTAPFIYDSVSGDPGDAPTFNALNNNSVDLSVATTFDIADIRLAFQIQKWMERNARAGARYTEFLKAHFGVSPRDERLDRPEYIGGTKSPVIISEVLQTSETDTSPQGNLAGHGITITQEYCGKYHADEYGLIIGIMSVMPKPDYCQGINKQWLRQTKYDFYFPEFANLSEQAITNAEIFVTDGDSTTNTGLFGYQGRYDEMRTKQNMICGQLRDTYDYWHLGRIFASVPTLNQAFIECVPDKRIFAADTEPGLIIEHGNLIKAFRPIPISSEPGLIDHN